MSWFNLNMARAKHRQSIVSRKQMRINALASLGMVRVMISLAKGIWCWSGDHRYLVCTELEKFWTGEICSNFDPHYWAAHSKIIWSFERKVLVVPSACAFCRASSVVQVTLKSPFSSGKDVCRTSTCDFVSLTWPWCAWNSPGELTESLGTWYPVFARLGFAMMISAVPRRNGVCRLYWCLNRWTFVNFHRGILTRLFLENRHGMFFN